MEIINNITYPILNFFGYPILWEHPMFASIFEKVEGEIPENKFPDIVDGFRNIGSKYGVDFGFWKTREKLTAKRREAWPMMALLEDDFHELGDENVMLTDSLVAHYWSLFLYDIIPEVVPPEVWDDAFDKDDDSEYDEWLRKGGFEARGILLRPYEGIACPYLICKAENTDIVVSMCLLGRHLMMFHTGAAGFLSNNIEVPDGIFDIARDRSVKPVVAYFQEDVYNLLRYYHYVHVAGKGTTKILHRGDAESFRGTTYKSMTDTPLLFVTN